jgi:hypothetical protein
MKLRPWQFALVVIALGSLGYAIALVSRALHAGHLHPSISALPPVSLADLQYVWSWFVALVSISLFGFYLTELVRLVTVDSGSKPEGASKLRRETRSPEAAPPELPCGITAYDM